MIWNAPHAHTLHTRANDGFTRLSDGSAKWKEVREAEWFVRSFDLHFDYWIMDLFTHWLPLSLSLPFISILFCMKFFSELTRGHVTCADYLNKVPQPIDFNFPWDGHFALTNSNQHPKQKVEKSGCDCEKWLGVSASTQNHRLRISLMAKWVNCMMWSDTGGHWTLDAHTQ